MSTPTVSTTQVVIEDFPFIVIEHFNVGRDKRPKDQDLFLKGQDYGPKSLLKEYNPVTDSFSQNIIELHADDNRVCEKRWDYIDNIYVIQPCQTQSYFCESLDHPHYSVHPLEYQSYLKQVTKYQQQQNGRPILHYCENTKNHEEINGFLSITNIFHSEETCSLLRSFPLTDMLLITEQYGEQDQKRGNIQFDTGLTSSVCQKRDDKWNGISGPNQLQNTDNPLVINIKEKIYNLLNKVVPPKWVGEVYNDSRRKSLFALPGDGVGDQHIHSIRMTSGHKYFCLQPHVDKKNDNNNPKFALVMVISWILEFP
jgi:hypothetical protein